MPRCVPVLGLLALALIASGASGCGSSSPNSAIGAAAAAGCDGTKAPVRTVTVPPLAPPRSQATQLSARASGGEESISVRQRLRSGQAPRVVPHFQPATGCGMERWAVKTLTD